MHNPQMTGRGDVAPLSRSPVFWLTRSLSVEAEDKLIDFDAGRPGCGHLRKSPLSRFVGAFCLNSERASAFDNVGVHWSPVDFHSLLSRTPGGCMVNAKEQIPKITQIRIDTDVSFS